MTYDHDRFTAPNARSAGLTLIWTNLRGERPPTAQMRVRDARVKMIRALLVEAARDGTPPPTEASIALLCGVKQNTAAEYLRAAQQLVAEAGL